MGIAKSTVPSPILVIRHATNNQSVLPKSKARTCEYDDETLEYWVNTRTLGTMTKEDFEMMQRERKYEGEGGDELVFKPDVHLDKFDFSDDDRMIHKNEANLEGDHRKSASQMMSMMTGCFAPQVFVPTLIKLFSDCAKPI